MAGRGGAPRPCWRWRCRQPRAAWQTVRPPQETPLNTIQQLIGVILSITGCGSISATSLFPHSLPHFLSPAVWHRIAMFSVYVFNENDKLIIIEIFELSFVPVTFFAPKSLTVDATGPFFHTLQKSLSENKCENLFFFSFIAFF